MVYWSPTNNTIEQWTPSIGWNVSFSEKEKLQCTNLFFFFKNKKGFKDSIAENLAHMVVFKEKYKGLKYSDEQEAVIREALKTVFNT